MRSLGTPTRPGAISRNTACHLRKPQRFSRTPDALDWDDAEHSHSEQRFKRLGASLRGRILIVVYTQRRSKYGKEIIRIISARQATHKERKAYAG